MTKNQQTIANLKKLKSVHNGSYGADIDRAVKALEQEQKTGKWIYDENGMDWNLAAWRCSECHVVEMAICHEVRREEGERY